MGKFRISASYLLGLFCAAAVAVPAVAGTLSVDVSPTTGYAVTNRSTVALPPRATSGPIATYNPTLGPLVGGGAYQTTSSGITITAIDQTAYKTTMSGRVMAGASAMKGAAVRCFTSFRCNLALTAGAAGINALFDGLDWVMGDGGKISRIQNSAVPAESGGFAYSLSSGGAVYPTVEAACSDSLLCKTDGACTVSPSTLPPASGAIAQCEKADGWIGTRVYPRNPICPAGSDLTYMGCTVRSSGPVPLTELSDAINSSYSPDPSDLPFLSGGLDFSAPDVNFEIVDIPSITGASSPNYIENSDGTSTATYSEFEFAWTEGPSKQPEVSAEETHHEQNYSDTGQPTDSSTTTVVSGGSPASPDVPTDCDFMPTVCRFIDWFTEPDPEINQDVDFSQLIDDVEIDRDFSVGSSTAACPAPFVVELSWVPAVEVSLQPFCDFADMLRPVLLAIASLFSGMIILRT